MADGTAEGTLDVAAVVPVVIITISMLWEIVAEIPARIITVDAMEGMVDVVTDAKDYPTVSIMHCRVLIYSMV